MKTIRKFTLSQMFERKEILINEDFEFLSLKNQYEKIQFWAMVDTSKKLKHYFFYIANTGDPLPVNPMKYLGTVQLRNGNLVKHIFIL